MACCPKGCGRQSILRELKDLVNQIGDGCCNPGECCPQPCCTPVPVNFPFAQVVMTRPPPILAPTYPEPVQPLQLPCPSPPTQPMMSPEEAERARYANFYNNYNVDYRDPDPFGQGRNCCCCCCCPGQTDDKPRCEDYMKPIRDECEPLPGCPTGFKPCTMKLMPPSCCEPLGPWCAQVQPCPPKPKKKNEKYEPGPCTRPCCKHWKPKEGPCLYDDPCLAHCFNHPPGIKPSGRFP